MVLEQGCVWQYRQLSLVNLIRSPANYVFLSSGHCSTPDNTPTFSNHIQGRLFKRSVEEYFSETENQEHEEEEENNDPNLEEGEKLVTSPTEDEKEGVIEFTSEENILSLNKRVQLLENTVAKMANTLTTLEDAFKSLQKQASAYPEKSC